MSALGTKARVGRVDSLDASTSRFSWTCNSCFLAISDLRLSNLHGTRLVAFSPRNEESQNAVLVLGLDTFGIDLHGDRDCAIKVAPKPFASVVSLVMV
jgi:hypothetical protein